MYLFDLGHLPGQQSMLVFHALARMGVEGLVIVSPDVPLVSVGYFQDAGQEVDMEACRRFPSRIDEIYPWISSAAVETYGAFGIRTAYREVNDIVTAEGRKIAGQGGGDIGRSLVFVGGILLDFDTRAMSRVLRVPDEKFRDKVFKTMDENLTTMRRELGQAPPRQDVVRVLAGRFEKLLGRLEPAAMTPELAGRMKQLEAWMASDEFLFRKTRKRARGVKIREGVEVHYGMHKARGGLIRTAEEIRGGRIEDLAISGDFTFFPKEDLAGMEWSLLNSPLDERSVTARVEEFYERSGAQSPGVDPADITEAVLKPVR
jgi:lipoate-protein ligase A